MIYRPKSQHTKILLGIFGIAAVAGIAIFINTKTGSDIQTAVSDKSQSAEELQQEMSRIAQYEFEHGYICVTGRIVRPRRPIQFLQIDVRRAAVI